MNTANNSMAEPAGPWLTPHQKQVDLTVMSLLDHPTVKAARDRAEGRHRSTAEFSVADGPRTMQASIDGLLFSCLQIAVNRDPFRPGLIWTVRLPYRTDGIDIPDSHHGGDNPDRAYRMIGVSPEYRYEIRGRRHPTHPTSGEVYFEAVRPPGLYGQPLIGLHSQNIDVTADGTFCITADGTPANGRRNHLYLPPETMNIVVRDTFLNWGREIPNEVDVRMIDGPSIPERTRDELARDGAELFEQCVEKHLGFVQFCLREQPSNTMIVFERPVHWGMGGGLYSINRFELADDEAFVIMLELCGAHAFNITTSDPWAAAVNYSMHTSCFNQVQAQPDRDGTFTFVVSARDPGVHNWLDTAGLRTGGVIARWDARSAAPLSDVGTDPNRGSQRVWAPENRVDGAVLKSLVVKVRDVLRHIPTGQARVSAEERMKIKIRRRAEHNVRVTSQVVAPLPG